MLARPLASETVTARAVCRLKCSVVANVAAGPRRWPRVAASAPGVGPPPLPEDRFTTSSAAAEFTARTGTDGGTRRPRQRLGPARRRGSRCGCRRRAQARGGGRGAGAGPWDREEEGAAVVLFVCAFLGPAGPSVPFE